MKRILLLTGCLIMLTSPALSQSWQPIQNAPVSGSRIDDVSFINATTGWVAERGGSGKIWKTTNGGETWTKQFEPGGACFRSLLFADSLRGWVGLLGTEEFCVQTDTNIIYYTTDGGDSWFPATAFSGPKPRGICGMRVLNDSLVFAVGRVRGPAFFLKSSDGGKTWVSRDLSAFAAGLVDVHFFSPDSGIAVGMTSATHSNSSGIILGTSDGGATWDTLHVSSQTGEWCWKISFPTRSVGYVSLQRNSNAPVNLLKTVDGGATWFDIPFTSFHYYVQGIGFADEMTGWIGGNNTYSTYFTTDGGATWSSAGFGSRVNRFQFLPGGIGFAGGQTVYKYDPTATGVSDFPGPAVFSLEQNFPNPFNPSTVITYHVSSLSRVRLSVVDILGREIAVLVDEEQTPGTYQRRWEAGGLPAGVYFSSLRTGDRLEVRKMILLR